MNGEETQPAPEVGRSANVSLSSPHRGHGTTGGDPATGGSIGRRGFLKLAGASAGAALLGPRRTNGTEVASTPMAQPTLDTTSFAAFATNPPFSFVYDGQPSNQLLSTWPRTLRSVSTTDERVEKAITWTDPKNRLEVVAVVVNYPAYQALEWTVYFNNGPTLPSRRLSQVLAANAVLNASTKVDYTLHHFKGSAGGIDDYAPFETPLIPGATKLLFPVGGRPSNTTWPYFNVDWGQMGAMIAIGWPGQWTVELLPDASRGLVFKAGMTSLDPGEGFYDVIEDGRLLDTELAPGDQVRTPLVVVMPWSAADWSLAQNSWRRWMWEHNIPRFGGSLPTPVLATEGAVSLYPNRAAELSAISSYVEERTTKDQGGFYTHWWIDAGWYAIPAELEPTNWSAGVGNWFPDPNRFPGGLRPVFDDAASHGMRSILWSEPERAVAYTWIADNHPEWLLSPTGPVDLNIGVSTDGDYLVNFGLPDALSWMIEHFNSLISTQGPTGTGIAVLRQDFNMDPLDYWNAADTPDRTGMTQMKHVLGHLAFWDELRRRHPEMWIDSCASGGRRNDLESMRRAVPFWRSDYQVEPTGAQCQTYGISYWLPYYGAALDPQVTRAGSWGSAGYVSRSSFAPCLISNVVASTATPADWDLLRQVNQEFLKIKDDLLYSDYYPLTPYSLADDVWMAMQFHRPEAGQGVVEVFRRQLSSVFYQSIRLAGLDADRSYRVTNLVLGGTEVQTGRSLMESGLTVVFADAPDVAILSYAALR